MTTVDRGSESLMESYRLILKRAGFPGAVTVAYVPAHSDDGDYVLLVDGDADIAVDLLQDTPRQ